MENASKALIMAGGMLIALMIIGALILAFGNLSSYQNQKNASTLSSQIAEFNNQFEPYNKDDLTLMELKSLYNKIESYKSTNPEYEITTNIENLIKEKFGETISDLFCNNFSSIEEKYKIKCRFKCKEIQYNSKDGRIKLINFSFIDNTMPK